jgi:hypothetical protein
MKQPRLFISLKFSSHSWSSLLSFGRGVRCVGGVVVLTLALLTLWGTSGCSRGPGSLAVRDSSAFQSAPAELKSMWDTALSAAKTNGYAVAYSNLQKLQAQKTLNAEQSKAVEELLGVVGTRMFNAANNGDPEATKALKEVDSNRRR